MNKKYIILVTIFTVLLVGIVGAFIVFKKSIGINDKVANDLNVVNETNSATNLMFTPTSINVGNGQTFSSNVNLLTESIVTGVDIEFIYDPATIQLDKIIPVSLVSNFTNPANWQIIRNEINNKWGNARFIAFTVDPNLGITGKEGILKVEGTVKGSGEKLESYQIDYGPLTAISARNKGYNILMSKSPLTLNVF